MRRVLGRSGVLVPVVVSALVASALVVAVPASVQAAAPDAESVSVPDAENAPDASSASAIAVEHGHPVVVDSETTPTSQVSALPDGTMQLVSNTLPVRVKQDGAWVPVDLTLKADAEGWLAPAASVTPVRFSPGGTQALVAIQTP